MSDPVAERHTDADLIGEAQAGDYAAFEEIVRRYQDRVFRLALSMTKNDNDAEEVMQDAFLNIYRNLHGFRGDSALGSWIYRVTANSALMKLRGKRRKPLLSIEEVPNALDSRGMLNPPGSWARLPEEQLLNDEVKAQIQAAMEALPEKYRVVLLLRDVEGLTNDQVAETLGVTVPTVKSRLHRSRLFVREALERYFSENGA